MSEESCPRVLYVGNLDASVNEDLLLTLFGQLGSCRGCKMIREAGSDMYAFIEFERHNDARLALVAMNKRELLGREMKVNWATSPGQGKVDISKHYHVFVGDLSPDIESHQLREAFAPFGAISYCNVVRDANTNQSKGYGFVCFYRLEDAEMAIASMNGQWLGGRSIRTNWAAGKMNANAMRDPSQNGTKKPSLKYEDVFSQSGPNNSTVYCGGVQNELTEQLMRDTFSEYGTIVDIKAFKDKGYAFVKFDNKESAANAIVGVNGMLVNGYCVRCSWGKESFEPSSSRSSNSSSTAHTTSQQQQPPAFQPPPMPPGYGYYGYWGYPPHYPTGYPPAPPGGYMPMMYPPQQNYGYPHQQQQQPVNGSTAGSWQPPPPST